MGFLIGGVVLLLLLGKRESSSSETTSTGGTLKSGTAFQNPGGTPQTANGPDWGELGEKVVEGAVDIIKYLNPPKTTNTATQVTTTDENVSGDDLGESYFL